MYRCAWFVVTAVISLWQVHLEADCCPSVAACLHAKSGQSMLSAVPGNQALHDMALHQAVPAVQHACKLQVVVSRCSQAFVVFRLYVWGVPKALAQTPAWIAFLL